MSSLLRITKTLASRGVIGPQNHRVITAAASAINNHGQRALLSGQSSTPNQAKVQCQAPDFKGMAVVNGQFKEISLNDFKGKYLVLFFYPLDFTFVCPTEVIAFNDRSEEFKQLNAEVVAVSVDSHFSHLAWVNTPRKNGGLGTETKLPILSDLKKTIAANYGCLTKNEDIALRALYIIDTKGVIRQITINDLPVGRSVDEILRLIKAFQYADEHGEVCPANWQPKSKTIDPKKAKEYFASEYSK